ncbi:MAG TPA: M43 family zinc metalloprotease [Polyangiales bacterium]|jgi:hypothetical protein|nr:M43 family zinc metalloprotease [Polyangiales bacterium]
MPPSDKRAPVSTWVIALVLLGVLASWLAVRDGRERHPHDRFVAAPRKQTPTHVASEPSAPSSSRVLPHRAAPLAPKPAPAAPQTPTASTQADPESHCGGIGAFGRCEGDVAVACIANAIYKVDCAKHRLRCAITDEGAQCLWPDTAGNACNGSEPAACVRGTLRRCADGLWDYTDCMKRGATCVEDTAGARCANVARGGDKHALPGIETCNGRDDDLDGRVDEDGVCEAISLVAYVPAGFQPPGLDETMQSELAILNRIYSPLRFRWIATRSAPEAYRVFRPQDLETAAKAMSGSGYPAFYVPVLYVEDLVMEPPKAGLSTFPNNRCGGVRLSDRPAPADGLIVLSEGRQPETLAHEVGHYLGLCHTHQELAPIALADGAPVCNRSGDGICDTPRDPGPSKCLRDAVCDVACPGDDATPDPTNVMSYYIGCRQKLTPEQLTEATRNLSLRRSWFACLDPNACSCTPAGTPGVCPPEMSCQPTHGLQGQWTCTLDGSAIPGAPCGDASECSGGSFCLRNVSRPESVPRCVRPCQPGDACACIDVGLPFRICNEDMPEARGR